MKFATVSSMRQAIARTINVTPAELTEGIGNLLVVATPQVKAEWFPTHSEAVLASFSDMPEYLRMLEQRSLATTRQLDEMGVKAGEPIFRHAAESRWAGLMPGPGGACRLTYMSLKGVSGYSGYRSREDAAAAAAQSGFTVADDGALNRLMQTPSFRRGLFESALMGMLNGKEISFQQAHERMLAYDNLDGMMDFVRRRTMQAFNDPATNTTVFVADRVSAGSEQAVFLHEIIHRHGLAVIGPKAFNQLVDGVSAWSSHEMGSPERTVHDRALARAVRYSNDSTREGVTARREELFAYAVEEAVNLGIQPSATAAGDGVGDWLGAVVDTLRTVGNKLLGNDLDDLTLQDVVDLSYALAQLDNPKRAAELRQALGGNFDVFLEGLRQEQQAARPAPTHLPSNDRPPFMTAVGGHVIIHDDETGKPLPEHWTGVCVSGGDSKKFWYVGRDGGERSFDTLKASDYPTALVEAQGALFTPTYVRHPSGSRFSVYSPNVEHKKYALDEIEPFDTYASEEDRFDAHQRGLGRTAEDSDNLTSLQKEILSRMRSHSNPVLHTTMGFEIDGRYLCRLRDMRELVELNQVTATYVDHPGGSRLLVYSANVENQKHAQDEIEPVDSKPVERDDSGPSGP